MAYETAQIPHRDVKSYLLENLSKKENPQDHHLRYVGALFGGG